MAIFQSLIETQAGQGFQANFNTPLLITLTGYISIAYLAITGSTN